MLFRRKTMTRITVAVACALLLFTCTLSAQEGLEKDVIKTSAGNLEISFVGHGSLMMRFAGKIIHIDPFSRLTDYRKLPRADLILITHQHGDHLDPGAIDMIRQEKTVLLLSQGCAGQLKDATVMKNGDVQTVFGVRIEAVPAYNLVHKRPDGNPFHPRGEGNGYVLTFGKTRVYVAGDTENSPEMKALKNIDIAFLPMNLPYTMTPEMVADAAKSFRPKILYPYHFGETDPSKLVDLLKDSKDIEVRVRRMK
jgi:L-ascorbate metabolism protein UlaG (beta-lactamase superfamily)